MSAFDPFKNHKFYFNLAKIGSQIAVIIVVVILLAILLFNTSWMQKNQNLNLA